MYRKRGIKLKEKQKYYDTKLKYEIESSGVNHMNGVESNRIKQESTLTITVKVFFYENYPFGD